MATSVLLAFALGPLSLLGQALVKSHLAIGSPCRLYIVIVPFFRASDICPCSTSPRHFHISMASVIPRLRVMLFHFKLPATFLMTYFPLSLALYSTTSFSLPSPVHSRNAPTSCPWNSILNHADTNGSLSAMFDSLFYRSGHSDQDTDVLSPTFMLRPRPTGSGERLRTLLVLRVPCRYQ